MIQIGTRLRNNETGVVVTVVKTLEGVLTPGKVKWVFYLTPAKGGLTGHRLIRIAADRIFPLPADGKPRKRGYTLLEGCEVA